LTIITKYLLLYQAHKTLVFTLEEIVFKVDETNTTLTNTTLKVEFIIYEHVSLRFN